LKRVYPVPCTTYKQEDMWFTHFYIIQKLK
jgi:hypothetical protein